MEIYGLSIHFQRKSFNRLHFQWECIPIQYVPRSLGSEQTITTPQGGAGEPEDRVADLRLADLRVANLRVAGPLPPPR